MTLSPCPPAMRLATVMAGTSPWLHTIHDGSICTTPDTSPSQTAFIPL
jgi:hypothetical protein